MLRRNKDISAPIYGDIAMPYAPSTRRPRDLVARVPSAVETILQVIAEAMENASAARCRYPLAD
jgi:hypothetical protein